MVRKTGHVCECPTLGESGSLLNVAARTIIKVTSKVNQPIRIAIILSAVLMFTPPAFSYDLPPVNLGFTSFMDGAPPAGPGFYFTQYVQYYSSDSLQEGPPNHQVDALIGATQVFYQSKTGGPWGSKLGMDAMLFYADFDVDPANSPYLQENSSGIGDVLLGPWLQWDPIMGEDGPKFMHRIEFQMILPTGKHSDQFELNPGNNVFSFNPYWAATYFITPRWTTSWRLHYLWNGTNNDPSIRTRGAIQFQRPDLEVNKIQAGQAAHLNFTAAYEVIPQRFRMGLNGYYLKQTTDTRVDGQKVSGRREEVFAIGPGGVWHFSQHTHLFFNMYFETSAQNRPKGDRWNLRFVHHF